MAPSPRHLLAWTLAFMILIGPAHAALSAPSAAAARISGRIFEPDLVTPAAELVVQAYPEGAKTPVAARQTDQRGRFNFESLPAGTYILFLFRSPDAPLAGARVEAAAGSHRIVALALPDQPAEGATPAPATPPPATPPAEKKKHHGLFQWMGTPVGATVTLVAAAAVLAVVADEITSKENVTELPVSPTQLP